MEAAAEPIVLVPVLGLRWGPEGVRSWTSALGNLRKRIATHTLLGKESTRAGRQLRQVRGSGSQQGPGCAGEAGGVSAGADN